MNYATCPTHFGQRQRIQRSRTFDSNLRRTCSSVMAESIFLTRLRSSLLSINPGSKFSSPMSSNGHSDTICTDDTSVNEGIAQAWNAAQGRHCNMTTRGIRAINMRLAARDAVAFAVVSSRSISSDSFFRERTQRAAREKVWLRGEPQTLHPVAREPVMARPWSTGLGRTHRRAPVIRDESEQSRLQLAKNLPTSPLASCPTHFSLLLRHGLSFNRRA